MIGRLKYGSHTLTFEDDLTWTCVETPLIAELFGFMFSTDIYSGPQDGFPGPFIFGKAVDEMGCEVLDAPKPTKAPEEVY